MNRVSMVAVVALVAALMAAPASAAPTKWVRGPVTAMTGNTITVTVKGAESTFKVETTTQLIARGAGTASREPLGVKLSEFVKVGQFVEVRYTEAGGAKVATEIRPLAAEEESASKEKTATVSGNTSAHGAVVSVAGDAVVVNTDGADVKFTVTPKTLVLGTGMGTKERELQAAGKPSPITAFIGPKDEVVVYYTDGATKAATQIRVIRKAPK
jgi:hypothetical protein